MTLPGNMLIKLGDSNRTLADPQDDIRGRTVEDIAGHPLGTVDELLIDMAEAKVRLLRVHHGGTLGFGTAGIFIPVDAIVAITDAAVQVNQSRDRVSRAPRYDPGLVNDVAQYRPLYEFYGYPYFWGPGYTYPSVPRPR